MNSYEYSYIFVKILSKNNDTENKYIHRHNPKIFGENNIKQDILFKKIFSKNNIVWKNSYS